jgi:hypothetical protein
MKGKVFGRLTVLEKLPGGLIQCRCECGVVKAFHAGNVRSGRAKSCGCLNRELIGDRARSHGQSKTPEYRAWCLMWSRCTNPTVDRYPRYGGRGISVCERWESFENFIADMGPKPSRTHSIGRINNDGNYEPGNCKWETRHEQANNTCTTVFIDFRGKQTALQDVARELGIPNTTLIQRVRAGMPPEKLFDTSPGGLTPRPIVVDGVSRLTTEWMQVAGIPISSFYHHRRKGLTEEEGVRLYLSKKQRKQEEMTE